MKNANIDRLKKLRMTDESRKEEYLERIAQVERALEDAMEFIDGLVSMIEEDFPFEEISE